MVTQGYLPKYEKSFLPFLSAREIGALNKEDTIILLPIASIEQHGPHLPVYTDSLIAMEVLNAVLDLLDPEFPLYYLPLLSYGRSLEHLGFQGTISLSSETLLSVLMEIAASISDMGFRRLVIFNSHGGNSELIDVAMRDIRSKRDLYLFGMHIFLRIGVPKEGLSDTERVYGIHAGDIETSILLHSCPDFVKMEYAPDGTPKGLLEGEAPPFSDPLNYAWLTRDIAPSGVLGNAKTADPRRGAQYLSDAAVECVKLLHKVRKFRHINERTSR